MKSKIDDKLPWFKFYARDFFARITGLTNSQIGIYLKLLAYMWTYGPQPNDLKVINSIVQGGQATQLVLDRFFEIDQNGKLFEPRLEVLRDESLEMAEANRKRTAEASAKRWSLPSPRRDASVTETEERGKRKDERGTRESHMKEAHPNAKDHSDIGSTLHENSIVSLDKKPLVEDIPQVASGQRIEPDGAAQSRTTPDYSSAPPTPEHQSKVARLHAIQQKSPEWEAA